MGVPRLVAWVEQRTYTGKSMWQPFCIWQGQKNLKVFVFKLQWCLNKIKDLSKFVKKYLTVKAVPIEMYI